MLVSGGGGGFTIKNWIRHGPFKVVSSFTVIGSPPRSPKTHQTCGQEDPAADHQGWSRILQVFYIFSRLGKVQNPYDIPLHWLVIGSFGSLLNGFLSL